MRALVIEDDPLLQAYVESLWQPLMRAARQQGHVSERAIRAHQKRP